MSAVIFNWHGIVAYQSVTNVRRIGSADMTSTLKITYKTRIVSMTKLANEGRLTSALMGVIGAAKSTGFTICFERARVKANEHEIKVVQMRIYLTTVGQRL
jgi:hypothetical protein